FRRVLFRSHQEKEAQIDHGTDLAHEVERRVGCLRTEVAQHQEVDDENTVQILVPGRAVADGLDWRIVEPWQEEQDDHSAAHGDHTPELGVDGAEQYGNDQQDDRYGDAHDALQVALQEQGGSGDDGPGNQHPGEVGRGGTQHGIKRREVPHRRNVRWCLQGGSRGEGDVFQEVPTQIGDKEHDSYEDDQEDSHTHDVVNRVVRVEGDAVQGATVAVFEALLDFNAVRVVGAYFMQGNDVCNHQADQHQRN